MGKLLVAGVTPHPPIIIPEIGKGEEKKSINTVNGMKKVANLFASGNPDTVIVITPHGMMFRDAISILNTSELSGSFSKFGFPSLRMSFDNDSELVKLIVEESVKIDIPIVPLSEENRYGETTLDWGVLVPMYFLKKMFVPKLVVITYGLLSPKELESFGEIIKKAIERSNSNVGVIASGDLSHKLKDDGPYGFSEYGAEFDKKIVEMIKSGDYDSIVNFDEKLSDNAAECGLRSFQILAGILKDESFSTEVYSYEGPFGVGYLTAGIKIG